MGERDGRWGKGNGGEREEYKYWYGDGGVWKL